MTNRSRTPLYDNAIDSLSHGISHYLIRKEHSTAIKHAVLNIYHCIELLLKEQLASINKILIYRNIDRRITDDSQTVGLGEIIARLENVGEPLKAEEIKALTELQKKRNRIEHLRFDPSEDHELAVGQGLKFLLDFLPEKFQISLENFIERNDDYRAVLDAILSYTERKQKAIIDASAARCNVITCPECGEDTLAIDSSRGDYCYMCHKEFEMVICENCNEYFEAELMEFGMCEQCSEERFRRF